MKYCGMCKSFSRDGIGCPEDHDTYGSCSTLRKTIEPDEEVCSEFKSREKVTLEYDLFVDVLADLNRAINACSGGHGNEYMWRALSDIEANLKEPYKDKHKLFFDIHEKLYGGK